LEELVFGVGGGLVGWSGVSGSGVSRGRVGWGRVSGLVCGLLGVFGLSFELDIGGVSVLIGLVVDDLGAAIGENNTVSSGGHFTIATLGMRIIEIGRMRIVVIGSSFLNSPVKAVGLGGLYEIRQ
jgi:hypothetical protein